MGKTSHVLVVLLLLAAPVAASILPAAETLFGASDQPTSRGEPIHPRQAVYPLPVTEDVEGAVRACIEYANTLGRARGRLQVVVEIYRGTRRIEKATFGGPVQRKRHLSVFYGCTEEGAIERELEAGDQLVFTVKYRQVPPLERGDVFAVTAGVTR